MSGELDDCNAILVVSNGAGSNDFFGEETRVNCDCLRARMGKGPTWSGRTLTAQRTKHTSI